VVLSDASTGLVVLDAATGRTRATHRLDPAPNWECTKSAAERSTFYYAAAQSEQTSRLIAVDLDRGERWRTRIAGEIAAIAADADAVYLSTYQELVALDPKSGGVRWSWGVDGWHEPIALAHKGAPYLVAKRGGIVVVFGRGLAPVPTEKFRVTGRLVRGTTAHDLFGVRVWWGAFSTTTSRDGRFELDARGRGVVRLLYDLPPSHSTSDDAIELTDAGVYQLGDVVVNDDSH
jgi:hypothetical protein